MVARALKSVYLSWLSDAQDDTEKAELETIQFLNLVFSDSGEEEELTFWSEITTNIKSKFGYSELNLPVPKL